MHTFPRAVTSTIAQSASNGSWVDTQYYQHLGLVLPAAFTGTAITFEAWVPDPGEHSPSATDSGNQINDKTGAAAVTVTFVASKAIGFDSDDLERLLAFRWIRPVSNGSEAAAREITFMLK